ncbi:hypothetical protein BHM03_00015546 [Ensete ventricosum]|uniref:Uncharacterized protein n=1 Tax=Ensete ventricosum TaxID=4639 RepID=A0A427A2Z7_ENSVE|nr:hypothetical protein B296_00011227 [Ensete ventricosum]RZR72656.1 hypothetical protein BHM03_00015546 [Ensete ventricosum]
MRASRPSGTHPGINMRPSSPSFAGLKIRLFALAMVAVVVASSLVEKAAAADAPAPSPTSGATTTALAAPAAALASFSALLFGYLLY